MVDRLLEEDATLLIERQAVLAAREVPADFSTSADPVELPTGTNGVSLAFYDRTGKLVSGDGPARADESVRTMSAGMEEQLVSSRHQRDNGRSRTLSLIAVACLLLIIPFGLLTLAFFKRTARHDGAELRGTCTVSFYPRHAGSAANGTVRSAVVWPDMLNRHGSAGRTDNDRPSCDRGCTCR